VAQWDEKGREKPQVFKRFINTTEIRFLLVDVADELPVVIDAEVSLEN
jgi:hypothetical protein